MPEVLLVAATERELCGHDGVVCGIGPVEAAAATARALAVRRPDVVLHVGVAGGRGLAPGSVVVGTESAYVDLAAAIPLVASLEPDPGLVATVRAALEAAAALPIATSASVGGVADDARVEAMEGFGVLRACALSGVPAVEVRAISNEIGEQDRSRWDLRGALASLDRAIPVLLDALRG